MQWAAEQARIRDQHWESLERLLKGLPHAVAEPFRLLEFELALHHSPTGRIRDIFTGVEQPPIPWVGPWLLADLGYPPSATRDTLESRLFSAAVLLGAREHLARRLSDAASFAADAQLTLALYLSDRAAELLTTEAGPVWLDADGARPRAVPDAEPAAHLHARWSEPMLRIGNAAVHAADLDVDREDLARMLHLAALGIEIRQQLTDMHEDLLRGRESYPIALVAETAGIPLRPWPRPELVLGATVLHGCHITIVERARNALDEACATAERLSLVTFAGYLRDATARIAAPLDSAAVADVGPVGRGPLIARSERPPERAIAMARGYLHADPDVRGSWEVHREGMFDAEVVSSRFPAALVLERLAWHGEVVADEAQAFLDATFQNGFRYYDHALSGVDTDTIGAFLRLSRFAPGTDASGPALREVLACLRRAVETTGRVPVWLECGGEPRPVIDLGEDCGTVAGHLLLGLDELPDDSLDDVMRIGGRQLLGRIGSVGLQANRNYPPAFALHVWQRLADALRARGGLNGELETAGAALRSELERLSRVRVGSAQDAAMLAVACLGARRPDLLEERWLGVMMRTQRSDGSWPGEPFTVTPNRGAAVTWYATSPMTTALVYDALQRWERDGP
jgi:hypothetical protein